MHRFRGDFRGPKNSTDDIPRSTQVWILLRELTRYYLDLKFDRDKNKDVDVRDVNDCVRLPADWAKLNAGNYVYYVSSKFSDLFESLDALRPVFGAVSRSMLIWNRSQMCIRDVGYSQVKARGDQGVGRSCWRCCLIVRRWQPMHHFKRESRLRGFYSRALNAYPGA